MKFASALSILTLTSCEAFQPSVAASRAPTALSATVERTKLIPPKAPADMMKDGSTGKIYDENVQKTYGRYPLTIERGSGCRLYTTDGKEYLDCVAGIATCALGHSNKALNDAIVNQMNQVHHVSNLYLIPAQAALADWLTANSVADKVFFCNSGAESNEAAIKCARKHAHSRGVEKPVIITAKQSFHGRTLATVTATGQPKYHKGFTFGDDMVPGFKYVEYNNVEDLEAAVKDIKESGAGLAAIMLEALQGEGGIVPGKPEFFLKARELVDQEGALLICDEVQVGMGRSGNLWGYESLPVTPDIFTSAKALGGGVPIGAMMAAGEAADVFGPGDHASTYGGNPLACAAGLAVAGYMADNNVLDNVQARGKQLSAGLEALAKKYPDILGEVRGWGLMKGVEVISEKEDVTAGNMVGAAMEEGLLLVAAGPTVVRFVPPLIISESEIDEALTKFEAALIKTAES